MQTNTNESVEVYARHTALARAVESLQVGVAVSLEDGVLVEANDALLELLGRTREQALGRTVPELLGEDLAVTRGTRADRYERSLSRADGRLLWVRVTTSWVHGRDDRTLLLVQSVEDITDLKAREDAQRDRALVDPLTGLANRCLLGDRLDHALTQRRRDGRQVGVLFADLDGFKAVNDRAGHAVGDQVLRELARRLAACARSSDTTARWSGDEFVVLCDAIADAADAHLVAGRVAAACSAPFVVDGSEYSLTISVGVAVTDGTVPIDAASLIEAADRDMYLTKRAHRALSTP